MAQPSSTLTTLAPVVQASLEEFDIAANRMGYIGLAALPIFDVSKKAGTFGVLPLEKMAMKPGQTKRAPKSGYARGSQEFTEGSFETTERGFEEVVDDNDLAAYGDYFDQQELAAEKARDRVLTDLEIEIAQLLFNTSTWTPTDVTNEWDDATNATPITDVEARIQAIYLATGVMPDTLIIAFNVFRNLRNCDQIINRIVASGAGDPAKPEDVSTAMLSAALGIPKILIGNGLKQTADEGQESSLAQIWDDGNAMVCKTAGGMDFRRPCVGRTFHWNADGSTPNGIAETYREEAIRAEIMRFRMQCGPKILYSECAQLLGNITS